MTSLPHGRPRTNIDQDIAVGTGGPFERHERLLRTWQLAILRFAVTLDDTDRLNVLAIAQEMDRFGRKEREGEFRFFGKTSADLCLAILHQSERWPEILRRYLAQIGEHRLKQAFAAAIGMPEPDTTPVKRRVKQDQDLFKGLPSRKVQA
jgi:hypothetical protein